MNPGAAFAVAGKIPSFNDSICTREVGATANTYALPVLPTSAGRYWMFARMLAIVAVTLPVHMGTPGVADLAKLMTVSARIGIADSARYLKKNKRMVGHLLTPGKFGPDALLEGVAPAIADPSAKIEALHVFTFNQVAAMVEWQRHMLASLDA